MFRYLLVSFCFCLICLAKAEQITLSYPEHCPVLKGAEYNPVLRLDLKADADTALRELQLQVQPAASVKEIRLVKGTKEGFVFEPNAQPVALAQVNEEGKVQWHGDIAIPAGESHIWLDVQLTEDCKVGSKIQLTQVQATLGDASAQLDEAREHRVGQMVAFSDDVVEQLDGSKRPSRDFRIPGLITTQQGSLVGSFDARYDGWVDLCADIDVVTVRSTDGGLTWTRPKVSLDIGAGADNGCGDACIVQDSRGRIWLQALGCHFGGGRCNRISQAGFDPATTGQWYMTYSDDDGQTWTRELINATKQLKKEEWSYILAGPGRGLVLRDGTIVFPAQFRQDAPRRFGSSMLCYSKDQGKTWQASKASFQNSSEAQIVELSDGSIMINCRAGKRSKARSVFVTHDLGETWERHSTDGKDLSEPSCQASIISIEHKKHGRVLLFSNPVNTDSRRQMSIRYSLDEGETWHLGTEYDSREGGGYCSLTQIDENHVGVFYESSKGHGHGQRYLGIAFLRIPIDELIPE